MGERMSIAEAISHLDEERAGRLHLERLVAASHADKRSQFVRHEPEGCSFCEYLEGVERALDSYRDLVRTLSREDSSVPPASVTG
jgi:hypothetical protein